MSTIPDRIREFLEQAAVEYEVIPHRTDHTAAQTAWDTHTPRPAFAKTVFVEVDGRGAMAVLPASDRLAPEKLRLALDARDVRVLEEWEVDRLCPDCEVGAAPPLGNLYALPVYVSTALSCDGPITFNGGTHRVAIRIDYADFAKLVEPDVVPLARHD